MKVDDLPGIVVHHLEDVTISLRDGKYHRPDGPALEYKDGGKRWFIMGRKHREDGPAVENVDGSVEWYLHGRKLSESEIEDQQRAIRDRRGMEAAAEIDKGLPRPIKRLRALKFQP